MEASVSKRVVNILSIAGSDPSGGAGIQADLKAISANGGYGMAALTGLTAQNTQGVQGVELISPEFVAAQVKSIRDDIRVDAVKIGMLGTAGIIEAVAGALEGLEAPVVLDPVMVAKGGDRLLHAEAVAALRDVLLPRATVITPNLPEAADLLGEDEARDLDAMEGQARALLELGARAVLLKGGHMGEAEAVDLLCDGEGMTRLRAPRYETRNTHGTGCTLSSALATWLGRGDDLRQAATKAWGRAMGPYTISTRFGEARSAALTGFLA
jgi:hydroxymethylpyrimidine/phosphomethylpyrimidine kinase